VGVHRILRYLVGFRHLTSGLWPQASGEGFTSNWRA
jgi:hypothetical protein